MNPWLSFGGAFLGFWLLAAPLTLGYKSEHLIHSDLICGLILLILGLVFRRCNSVWVSWGFALVGFWLGFAPLLFWAPDAACYINDTIVGALILALFTQMPAMPNQVPDSGPAIPPGWNYNPSSWPQRLPIAMLAFIGWMASRYMAAYQLGYIDTVFEPFFENPALPFPNETLDVITSKVSKAFPVPDAGLGAFAYSIEMITAFKGGTRRWRTEPWMVILFGLLAVPLSLVSVILIISQPLLVGAWCSLCLFTAFCMLILITLSIDEVAAVLQYLKYSKEKPFLKLLLEGGICDGAKEDTRTPSLDQPLSSILDAARWGVTVPWNLALSVLIGMAVMALPGILNFEGKIADADHLLGALTIVVSMISKAEIIRNVRFLNIFFALGILVTSFIYGDFMLHIVPAILIGALAMRKGPIRELQI